VLWQTPPPAPKCSIVRTSQTNPPVVNGFMLLEANCDQVVGSYSWNGCSSLARTCIVRETAPGLHAYSVIARNAGGSSPPATLAINWLSSASSAPGFCGQFPSYLYSDFDSQTVRVESTEMPPPAFAWNGAWTVRFVVPPTMPSTVFGEMASAEFAAPPIVRQATISNTPCDFRAVDPSGANGPYSSSVGSTNSLLFSINPARAGYPVLAPGGTYYYNVRNVDPSTNAITCSPTSGRCDALVESRLPG
jgi:hypothetical protein